MKSGKSLEDIRKEVLELVKAKMKPVQTPASSIQITADGNDKIRAAASDAILMRAGIQVEKPAEGANDFRSLSLERLAMDCISRSGEQKVKQLLQLIRMHLLHSSCGHRGEATLTSKQQTAIN